MLEPAPWLLLIHNIPPKPAYLRAKVAKRLAALGAVALKNAVYVLPDLPQCPKCRQCREAAGWLVQEIKDGGGKAFLVTGHLAAGLDDSQVRALFQAAREADYAALMDDAKTLAAGLPIHTAAGEATPGEVPALPDDVARNTLAELKARLQAVQALDFFDAPGRGAVEGLLAGIETALLSREERELLAAGQLTESPAAFQGKVWVTRAGVYVDRMASAWLILRFIDPGARFRFVDSSTHAPEPGEVTFDMQGADFTHVGERCTFETLIQRLGLRDQALAYLGEMVHDIDLREERYRHPATQGLALALAGVALGHAEDEARLAAGCVLLDACYEALRLQG